MMYECFPCIREFLKKVFGCLGCDFCLVIKDLGWKHKGHKFDPKYG